MLHGNHRLKVGFRIISVFSLLAGALNVSMLGCENRAPIKIGFAGGLTGPVSDLGIAGRNGVKMAVEEVNQAGGINSRPVELIVKDDRQDPEVAMKVDRELIAEGVVAIVGHMTSSMSVAVGPAINEEKMVMISPTTSTVARDGVDDHIFRLTPSHIVQAVHLADFSINQKKRKNIAVIYDLTNQAFSENLYKNFKSEIEKNGGQVIFSLALATEPDISFPDLAREAMDQIPDAVFFILNATDSALFCQHLKMIDPGINLISSPWGMTQEFINNGGEAAVYGPG